jgi:hypothetical protein
MGMIWFTLAVFALSAVALVANGVSWRRQGNGPMALVNIGLGVVQIVLLVIWFGGAPQPG